MVALVLVALISGTRRGDGEPRDAANAGLWPLLRERLGGGLLVAGLGVYLLSPLSYKWIWPISHRLIPLLAMVAVVAAAGRSLAVHRAWVALPAVALAIWAGMFHADRVRSFDAEAGPIREVLAEAERGKRLVALIHDRHSDVVNGAPYLHFSQYYVVDRGGMANFSFANMPQSPVVYPTVGGPPTLRPRWEWLPHLFDWRREGAFYDYVLLRGGSAQARSLLRKSDNQLALVTERGRWRLYRRVAAARP